VGPAVASCHKPPKPCEEKRETGGGKKFGEGKVLKDLKLEDRGVEGETRPWALTTKGLGRIDEGNWFATRRRKKYGKRDSFKTSARNPAEPPRREGGGVSAGGKPKRLRKHGGKECETVL